MNAAWLVRRRSTPLLASVLLLACGETHVTLLAPFTNHADAGSAGAGTSADAGAGTDAAIPPSSTGHLIHRYSFDGEGTRVRDSIGTAHGSLVGGAVLDGAGHVSLDGEDDYVNLPNRLLSRLTDATLIAWIVWNGGPCWQRAFDFGSTDAGEGLTGDATSSLFATPLRCPGTGPATSFQTISDEFGSIDSDAPFPVLKVSALAVVVDGAARQLRLYAAGEPLGTGKAPPLALLSDENDWLGRSQWVQDKPLRGTYDEFRIYDVALSDAELAALEAAGPDKLAF
ncbi:MAG TPA: LamG domain-containing protein [Polyangiaceae bacterium]|nr:LamG domain-containing protein [Polyangiaceae bacterium]